MIENIATFIITMMVLSITPGPCMTLSLNIALSQGIGKSNIAAIGDYIGLFIFASISAIGVGAVISSYPNTIKVIQYSGGIYIIYLGIKSIRQKIDLKTQKLNVFSDFKLMKIGFITLVSNPKAILFFSAFFPQFINPEKSLFLQLSTMIPIIIICEAIAINVYAFGGKALSLFLTNTKVIQYVSGGLLIFVGIWLGLK